MSPLSRAWTFLGITFAFTWACQLPAILVLRAHETPPPIVLGMMALGSAGPSTVALWFWVLEKGAHRRALPERRAWRHSHVLLWLCALLFNPLCHLLGAATLRLMGFGPMRHLLYLPVRPEELAIAVIAPLGEEFGFRGYALPRLQTRWSPLAASVWLGIAWAFWHVPTLLVPSARGTTPLELCLYLTCYLAGSVVYTWLFNAGNGSIVGPLLAHLGIHLDNVFRASTVGDGVAPLAATAFVMTLVAVVLVATGQLHPETAVQTGPVRRSSERALAARRGRAYSPRCSPE